MGQIQRTIILADGSIYHGTAAKAGGRLWVMLQECDENEEGLKQIERDFRDPEKTKTLAYEALGHETKWNGFVKMTGFYPGEDGAVDIQMEMEKE